MATRDDHLLARLLRRAHLFDDPAAYEAGVRDALELVDHEHVRPVAGEPSDQAGQGSVGHRPAAMVASG